MKSFLYYISYFYFLAMPLALWLIIRRPTIARIVVLGGFCAAITLLAYARFVEPRILLTRSHDLEICTEGAGGTMDVAVFSDTHNGLFGNAIPIRRIVDRVNSLEPDFVLIPGDFTYEARQEDLPRLFEAFVDLEAPAFAVLGNHDVGVSAEDMTRPLTATLQAGGIRVLNGGVARIDVDGKTVEIIGLLDHWGAYHYGNWSVPETGPGADFTIALEHNPDVLFQRRRLPGFDLMVSGHTHGGQIYLPGLTCALLDDACGVVRYGYLQHWRGDVFVTSGTGMVMLPLRFNMPPRIDMLRISYGPC